MNIVILDLSSFSFNDLNSSMLDKPDTIVLALSPSAFYYLELQKIDYISFHNLITVRQFSRDILKFYEEVLVLNQKNIYFKGFFRDIAQYVNYFYYIDTIIDYIKTHNFDEIYYITDKKIMKNNILSNESSLLEEYIGFTKVIKLQKVNYKNIDKINIIKKYKFSSLLKKIRNKIFKTNLKYDWLHISPNIDKKSIKISSQSIKFFLNKFQYIKNKDLKFEIPEEYRKINPYQTFLTKDIYLHVLEYKKLQQKLYFFQHGSYLYKNIFIKYAEVELSNINFVLNGYSKKLFEELGARKVYNVGSILFNQSIKEEPKEYDYLYITQGHDYTGSLNYVDFPNSLHSFDGHELYKRHKLTIELFGKQLKDKKILIRVHPLVLNSGLYVPFWEIAAPYPNVTIDVSIPIHTLIEKSKYIISDYFTTEFINRELHYKRDIILFKGAPTPLPEETMEDMEKMFILVDVVDDLEEKVQDIEKITKNRKRNDDIIEYYTSKKCNTKKVVIEIINKELENEKRIY